MEEKRITPADIDGIDREIIKLLQESGRRTNADIARTIDISESTVKNRINRLMEKGVLKILAVLNPEVAGYNCDIVIGINIKKGYLLKVGKALKEMNEVVYLGYTTGRYDVMIEVLLRDAVDLFTFTKQCLEKISGIISTEIFYVMHNEKINYEWKLPETFSEEETKTEISASKLFKNRNRKPSKER